MSCQNGCQPVEQVRGEMGPGDYYDIIAYNRVPVPGAVPEPEKYGFQIWDQSSKPWGIEGFADERVYQVPDGIRPEHCVEMNENNKNDFRICCKTCGKATPWGAKDFPGMPDAGADWIRKRWSEAA